MQIAPCEQIKSFEERIQLQVAFKLVAILHLSNSINPKQFLHMIFYKHLKIQMTDKIMD